MRRRRMKSAGIYTFCALTLLSTVVLVGCAGNVEDIEALKGFLSSGQLTEFINYVEAKQIDPFNFKDEKRQSLLHWLASIPTEFRDRQNEIWRKLLAPRTPTNVDAPDVDGNTPLHAAVLAGNSRYAGWLILNYNAKVNVKNKASSTPLHLAVEAGFRSIVIDLLKDEKSSSKLLYVHDSNGRTALHIAVEKDLFNIVEDLCQYQGESQDSYIHYRPVGNPSAFQLAITWRRVKILEYFIRSTKKVIDLQSRNLEGSTALQASLQFPTNRITKLLLARFGRDVTQLYYEDLFGHNVLHYAAKFGNNQVFMDILDRTPDADKAHYLNAKSSAQHWTPLHFAVANGRSEIVNTILSRTTSGIDLLDKNGLTPLMVAAGLCYKFPDGNFAVLNLLVNNGASRVLRNPHDKNAKGLCMEQDAPQCRCDILSPSVALRPTGGGNCSLAIQRVYGDDGSLPFAGKNGFFSTPLPIPLSADVFLDPNLTPRYHHQCGKILNGAPCFHVDILLNGRFRGQGVIIDEDFISTSASIFPSQLSADGVGVTVRLTTKSKTVFEVAQLFRHVNYKGGFDSDTVLLHLSQNIDFQLEEACPICLPYDDFSKMCFERLSCYVVGSKLGNLNQPTSSSWLFYEAGPAANLSYCQGIWNSNKEFSAATYCVENRDDWCTSASSSFVCVHKGVARLFGHQTLPRDPAHIRACPQYNAQTAISLITTETSRTFYRTTLQSIRQRLPAINRLQTSQQLQGVCERHVDNFLEVNVTSCPRSNQGPGGVDTQTIVRERPGSKLQLKQQVDKDCIGANGKLLEGAEVSYKCSRTYYKLEGADVQKCGSRGWTGGDKPQCKLICGKVFGTVFGGVKAREKEMPWAVALHNRRIQQDEESLPRISCGGSLIGTDWVLTAAHCLQEHVSRPTLYHEDDIQVYIGLRNNYDAAEAFGSPSKDVSKIIIHEEFDAWQLQNDVGLLKLSSHVVLSDKIQVICLPPADFPVDDYELVKVAAWGSKGLPDEGGRQDLILGEIALQSCGDGRLLCTGHYADFPNKKLASLCRGDSGSPVMVEKKVAAGKEGKIYYQVGIVSGKASRVSCEDLAAANGTFTGEREVRIMRVPNYVDWINKKMDAN